MWWEAAQTHGRDGKRREDLNVWMPQDGFKNKGGRLGK